MYHDVGELRNFYYRSKLGRATQARLQLAVRELIGDAKGEVLIGHGFAAPFLRPFYKNFENVLNFMPLQQGVMAWPPGEKNISALVEDQAWPLKAGVVDLAIVAHALENTESLTILLGELWRVLTQSGEAIIIVPNRGGVWAHGESTPFCYGRPFSLSQVNAILERHRFRVVDTIGALYAPPWDSRFGLRASRAVEWVTSRKRSSALAGALVLRVRKDFGGQGAKIKQKEPIFALPDLLPASGNSASEGKSPANR